MTTAAKVSKIVLLCYQLPNFNFFWHNPLQFIYGHFSSKSKVSITTAAKGSKIVLFVLPANQIFLKSGPITQQFLH